MTATGWFLIMLSAILAVFANLMLRAGVDRAGGFVTDLTSIHVALLNLVKQPMFDIGLFMYALATLVWIKILSVEQLSIAYPVMVSITFALVTLGAVLFFKESLNTYKILGLLIIFAGILIISRS